MTTMREAMTAVCRAHLQQVGAYDTPVCRCEGWDCTLGTHEVHLAHAILTDPGVHAALAERLRAFPVPETYEEWQEAVDRTYEGDAAFILSDKPASEYRSVLLDPKGGTDAD
jgi:hypothetical protein